MRFRRFLCHLKHEMQTGKIMLICDNASFHKGEMAHRMGFYTKRMVTLVYGAG